MSSVRKNTKLGRGRNSYSVVHWILNYLQPYLGGVFQSGLNEVGRRALLMEVVPPLVSWVSV